MVLGYISSYTLRGPDAMSLDFLKGYIHSRQSATREMYTSGGCKCKCRQC